MAISDREPLPQAEVTEAMFRLFRKPAPPPAPRQERLTREEIETLMGGPVAERPAITILGDEDVAGFTPAAPPPAETPIRRA